MSNVTKKIYDLAMGNFAEKKYDESKKYFDQYFQRICEKQDVDDPEFSIDDVKGMVTYSKVLYEYYKQNKGSEEEGSNKQPVDDKGEITARSIIQGDDLLEKALYFLSCAREIIKEDDKLTEHYTNMLDIYEYITLISIEHKNKSAINEVRDQLNYIESMGTPNWKDFCSAKYMYTTLLFDYGKYNRARRSINELIKYSEDMQNQLEGEELENIKKFVSEFEHKRSEIEEEIKQTTDGKDNEESEYTDVDDINEEANEEEEEDVEADNIEVAEEKKE